MKAWHVPLRLTTGAFILNSGLGKRGVDDEGAARLHGMAKAAVPQLSRLEPATFVRLLSTAEIALGGALLVPMVPSGVAGATLLGFSAGLARLYFKLPGMREEGSVRPTQQGTGLAKDFWMLAIGLGLVVDALSDRQDRRSAQRDGR